jgi:O-antigen/teichoic acid export membrane protein
VGIIQKQSIRSSIIIVAGFAIGAINMIVLSPRLLTTEQLGLTRMLLDTGATLASLCTFGCLPIIYKFFPFYRSYLPARKNDMPFITLMICLAGFVLVSTIGISLKDIMVRKFSERSPLFVEYSYLVYPLTFFMLLYSWLEAFAWSFKKGVVSNALRETLVRIIFTVLIVLLAFEIIGSDQFLQLFSASYLLPVIVLFLVLRLTGGFGFHATPSTVTRRLKGRMINFGLFLFGAQFLNLLSRTVDTFILSAKSERGLTDTAVFTIATYVVTLMEIPQRSMNSITIPVLAEAWKNKDLQHINQVYTKSVANLLVIGLLMFSLTILNVHNLATFLGSDYKGIEWVIFLLVIGKLIDLGTGSNSQVIGTSNYWKVDFATNVIYTLLALPLNYILISRYGLMGAAYSTLLSLTVYNLMRFGFLWYKFGLQPYTWKDLQAVLLTAIAVPAVYYIPHAGSIYLDAAIRTTVFCLLFVPAIYFLKVSGEINQLIEKYIPFFWKK